MAAVAAVGERQLWPVATVLVRDGVGPVGAPDVQLRQVAARRLRSRARVPTRVDALAVKQIRRSVGSEKAQNAGKNFDGGDEGHKLSLIHI